LLVVRWNLTQPTLRPDLVSLTMLPWNQVLPRSTLLRTTRAWCPACYHDRREGGQALYDPLLWALRVVTVCPHHQSPLQHRCPHSDCRRAQSPLGARARPGYCAQCGHWLGSRVGHVENVSRAEDVSNQAVWGARAMGELLASAPPHLSAAHVAAGIGALVEAITGGNTAAFARALHLDPCTVWQWRKGVHLPALDPLLQVCARLGVSPLHVLTGRRGDLLVAAIASSGDDTTRVVTTRARLDKARLRHMVEEIATSDETPPPSVQAVARRLDLRSTALLYEHVPDLCHAIARRRQAYLAEWKRQDSERKRAAARVSLRLPPA